MGLGTTLAAVALALAVIALALNFVVPGPAGSAGSSYTTATVLQPGQNESGGYSAWGGGTDAYIGTQVNYRIPLSTSLPAANVTFIAYGASATTNCTGPGQALPGHLCVYEIGNGSTIFGEIYNPAAGNDVSVPPTGFGIYFVSTYTSSWSYGTWTVSAP
jgi:hypothetical protein